MRIRHLQRDLVDARCGQHRKRFLVLAPLGTEPLFPANVGLDPVAITDMNSGLAAQTLGGPLQGPNPPGLDIIHVDVESRFVKLDHGDAGLGQAPRLLIEDGGKLHGQSLPVAVVLVGKRVGHRHRPRQLVLHRQRRFCHQKPGIVDIDRVRPCHWPHDPWYRRLIPIADFHGCPVVVVDPVQPLDECGYKMPAGLFAIGHDVDTGVLLFPEDDPDRVMLCFDQLLALQQPGCPQLLRTRQPRWLGEASSNRGGQQSGHLCLQFSM